MKNKKIRLILMIVFMLSVIGTVNSFAGSTRSGGDTGRNPVISFNLYGGEFQLTGEVEIDIRLTNSFSIAPRAAYISFDWWAPGVSLRFGIIEGVRPHGFWIGPSCDFIFHRFNGETNLIITPAAEFGWRYTFGFGFSLQIFTRLGARIGYGPDGFFWGVGAGIGYAF